jgi:hypothetical protein
LKFDPKNKTLEAAAQEGLVALRRAARKAILENAVLAEEAESGVKRDKMWGLAIAWDSTNTPSDRT